MRFVFAVIFAAVTTFWLGNVGVFLLVLWCAVVYAYCLPRRAHD